MSANCSDASGILGKTSVEQVTPVLPLSLVAISFTASAATLIRFQLPVQRNSLHGNPSFRQHVGRGGRYYLFLTAYSLHALSFQRESLLNREVKAFQAEREATAVGFRHQTCCQLHLELRTIH